MSNTDNPNNEALGFIIHDVARMMRWNFERRAHEYNLTRSQWSVLVLLSRENGAQQKRLADIIGVTAITMTGLVDRLERAELVERRQDPQDRRAKRVFLTDKVEPLMEKIKLVAKQVRSSALKGISAAEEQQLADLLRRMRANLREQSTD
ncbi:MAG: MarR family transcriptional regulator [Porticoccaceae bacterium]|jgi:MarR family transcriptional regulator for hemolysin|nr:MarR family transcriptional regulator [Porticoccaceae bacterium]